MRGAKLATVNRMIYRWPSQSQSASVEPLPEIPESTQMWANRSLDGLPSGNHYRLHKGLSNSLQWERKMRV